MRHALVVAILCLMSSVASAESFLEAYLGASLPTSVSEQVRVNNAALPRIDYESDLLKWTFATGVRAGYWFEGLPWLGVALDVSYFNPKIDDRPGALTEDFTVIPISPLLMARMLLDKSPEFPKGRFQPYVAAGPSLVVSRFDWHVSPPGKFTIMREWSADVGFDARLGLTWMLTRRLGLFAENRYTYFEPAYSTRYFGLNLDYSARLANYHAVIGATLRFD
jgi:hypothetical protein